MSLLPMAPAVACLLQVLPSGICSGQRGVPTFARLCRTVLATNNNRRGLTACPICLWRWRGYRKDLGRDTSQLVAEVSTQVIIPLHVRLGKIGDDVEDAGVSAGAALKVCPAVLHALPDTFATMIGALLCAPLRIHFQQTTRSDVRICSPSVP